MLRTQLVRDNLVLQCSRGCEEAMFVFICLINWIWRVNLSTQHFLSGQGSGQGGSTGFLEVRTVLELGSFDRVNAASRECK